MAEVLRVLRSSVGSVARRTPMYGTARRAYDALFARRSTPSEADRSRAFFGQFVVPGSLVFDIGANVGGRTAVFLSLGAKVVAVEPNPACAGAIRDRYDSPSLIVEEVAVGDDVGSAQLRIANESLWSSMVEGWFSEDRLVDTITVPITTIDRLIDKYGTPQFVKIDVEGFETQVLAGMSRTINCISFEFHTDDLATAAKCVDMVATADSRVNFSWEESLYLASADWVRPERLKQAFDDAVAQREAHGERIPVYGDIYVRNAGRLGSGS